ncbi:InlB B-repeat-containing protein [Erysipelothrix inopinata]|uniref:InlB B-repeat-containing protein n=2 Tax=Erysipelothrix inopinata TaxID=225084 RepID=A0A7G9RXW6_9FIRM|nr:InlB B-repeat-containing protein [Erysipelothrix inopinata]QNN60441.1 InlB B-repeat-containing protein [Erysipelothrix inopinata]
MKKTISITVSMSLLLFSFSNYALINAEESPLLDEPTANSNTNAESLDNKDEPLSIEEAKEPVEDKEILELEISENEFDQLEDNAIVIVTFDPMGGTMDKTVYEVDEGSYPSQAFSSYPEPKKEGFIFKGWYADEEYKVEISQSGRITENKTFYAYWEKEFDTSLISDDLVQYMIDAKGYELPFSEDDLNFVYDFETPYIFEDKDTSKFEYREIRDYTGIEYFKNVNKLTVRIDPNTPITNEELQGLAKMTNIYEVVFEAKLPEDVMNADYFDQDWYISKTLSSKENVKIFEDEVIKVLLALSFNPVLSGWENQVQIHFDYSLKFVDMSFLTQLNQRSESFSFEMQSGEIGTTFFEKPEVEIVDEKVYYKIVFDNPFMVTYLNSQNKLVVDSESKYMKNAVYSSYDFGSYDDYPDDYYDELDKPLIVRYLDRDGNLIEGFSDDIDAPEFFTRYEILLSEAQMADMIRRSNDPDYEMNTMNSPTKVLSGSMDYDIPDGAVDENGAIPEDNFNTYFSYQVLVDVGELEIFHRVDFDTNGGSSIDPILNIKNGSLIADQGNPVKPGYKFMGWYFDNDDFMIDFNFDMPITRNLTLYAQWEATDEKYTVTYEENGGTEVADLTEVESGTKLTEPTTTKVGYVFKGWYRDTGFTTVWNFDIDLVESDVTLYAKWEAIPVSYTVTYEENGGTEVADLTEVESGTKLTEPTTTKVGYVFKGWYRDTGFTTVWNFDIDLVESDVTLYAKWEAIPVSYTVTYEENGGTEVANLTEVETGTKLTEPTTTKAGYTFKGWYRDASFTTVWNFAVDLVESDVTLYAKWEAIPVTYTVTFEENGGTEVDDLFKVSAGTLLIEPITQREGFTFAGWYSDSTFLTQWNFTVDVVNSDITLFAKWNEKSIDPEVKPEPEVTEPETPKPEVKPEPVEKLPETGVAENSLPMAVAALGGMVVLLEMIKKKKDSYENKH